MTDRSGRVSAMAFIIVSYVLNLVKLREKMLI